MKIIEREDLRTCSACEETKRSGFVVYIGEVVFSFCETCLRRHIREAGKVLRALDRRRDQKEETLRALEESAEP